MSLASRPPSWAPGTVQFCGSHKGAEDGSLDCARIMSANHARYCSGTQTKLLGRTGQGASCLLSTVCMARHGLQTSARCWRTLPCVADGGLSC